MHKLKKTANHRLKTGQRDAGNITTGLHHTKLMALQLYDCELFHLLNTLWIKQASLFLPHFSSDSAVLLAFALEISHLGGLRQTCPG